MGIFSGGPPLPTDQGPDPAPDVPDNNAYSPQSDFNDTISAAQQRANDIKSLIVSVNPLQDLFIELLLLLAKIIGDLWLYVLEIILPFQELYDDAITSLHSKELPIGLPIAREMVANELEALLQALGTSASVSSVMTAGEINSDIEALFKSFIQPFALWADTEDPSKFGSGFANAKFLLERALQLTFTEHAIDSMKNLIGFGWVQTLEPMLGFVDRAINPSNVVRQAMEQAYSFLMKAPMQRDLNHLYPIKDLGLTALCKLYIRGAIDEGTYLDKCLDAGINNAQAQQLILETAKLLSTSQIGTLLNKGFIQHDDARQQLLEQGYPDWQADALIYLETHDRFFSIQERVGNEAVTAWKAAKITGPQFESLMQTLGFTPDEVNLLELEGQFTKDSTDQKALSYSQIKDMYKANIVDIDYVITFLSNENYAPDDITRLILLDFVEAEKRSIIQATLDARIRVLAAEAAKQAAAAAAKNETDLTNAKQALANQLNSALQELGLLDSLPSILDLVGISLP